MQSAIVAPVDAQAEGALAPKVSVWSEQMSSTTDLLSEVDTALILGLRVPTLRKWSVWRKGPPRVKIGKSVFYRRTSLEAWIAAQERDPAAALVQGRTGR
jgi:predicted DNA-binding transcriptional regulator AlpA